MHSENRHDHDTDPWRHDHSFGQEKVRDGERRTLMVIAITAVMMVVEIAAGILFGSMALLADGLHMASHTAAIGIAAFAYVYARRHAFDPRFSFGTGKVNALGGFGGAVLLVIFALFMAWESTLRFIDPVAIAFDQAIAVAVAGLIVNAVSAVILGRSGDHGHDHGHAHDHGSDHHAHEHGHGHSHGDDHNLRAAYLHVLADALTSVLAIIALLAGKYYALNWLDPMMGIVGAILVARWSVGLLKATSQVLLDQQASKDVRQRITTAIESAEPASVTDLHVWSIGPNLHAVEIVVVSDTPRTPDDYRRLLPADLGLDHVTVEVHQCPEAPAPKQAAAGG